MDVREIEQILKGKDEQEKIETVSHLSDVFESYNKNIENFEELIEVLLNYALEEQNLEVKEEMFDALANAVTYQNTEDINWDSLERHLSQLSLPCLITAINILGLTHDQKYLPTIKTYTEHENGAVKGEAYLALKEMQQNRS
ncbi:hypothetical protein [Bacillus sp. Marseille-Q3570]|uniref:hypothetical protein n=1 Tax=Bacillus sp. Marseille-Q3570 TaxID=2963522 RepID=UPI0021B76EF9|nr:hypothetical protein [Bacillus sp. Marseille-Q3570]